MAMELEQLEWVKVDERPPLTALDRCDRCGAAAKVRAVLPGGELYFCGHHARKAGGNLVLKSIVVHDPDEVLNYGKQ